MIIFLDIQEQTARMIANKNGKGENGYDKVYDEYMLLL